MCKRLKELNGMTAEDVLMKCGQLHSAPVDLEKIVDVIGVYRYARTFSDIEDVIKKEVAGLVLLNGDNVGIFYDVDAPIERKRFIIAHEIGHCCLHGETLTEGYIEFLEKDGFENLHEKEASVFAARLLIPKEPLLDVYNKLILPSLNSLAEIFEVPKYLMEYRLKELEMHYYITKGERFIPS